MFLMYDAVKKHLLEIDECVQVFYWNLNVLHLISSSCFAVTLLRFANFGLRIKTGKLAALHRFVFLEIFGDDAPITDEV